VRRLADKFPSKPQRGIGGPAKESPWRSRVSPGFTLSNGKIQPLPSRTDHPETFVVPVSSLTSRERGLAD
jgi:hypothetical protein